MDRKLSAEALHCDRLAQSLPVLVAPQVVASARDRCGDQPARLLFHALRHAPLVHQLEELLYQDPRVELKELARRLFATAGNEDDAVKATTLILKMAAAARLALEDYPLVPHRIHLLARPSEGMVVCLNAGCGDETSRPLPYLGPVLAGQSDHCPDCEMATLALVRCQVCGEAMLAGVVDGVILRPARGSDLLVRADAPGEETGRGLQSKAGSLVLLARQG